MYDWDTIVKGYVSAVCKSCGLIEVYIDNNIIIINMDDTALAVMSADLQLDTYKCFKYSTSKTTPADISVANKLLTYFNRYTIDADCYPVVAEYDNLRSNEEYEKLLNLKADEGGGFFRLMGNELYTNYLVPVFAGFPNINKADKIGIVVRRMSYDTLLMEYHIYKKKVNKDITIYFRTLDLTRKLSR